MPLTVVTGWHPAAWRAYARKMVRTFHQHWPASVDLIAYVETPAKLPRGEQRMLDETPGWLDFYRRWKDDPAASGIGSRGRPYHYRHDAVKFARMAYIATDAAERLPPGLMVWFDADTYTTSDVPNGWIEELLGGADVAYLGRERMHPDIGFVAYRLPAALPFLQRWRAIYADGSFHELEAWHSAAIWQVAFKELSIHGRNLSPGLRDLHGGHVWPHSPLAAHTVHLKGKLKHRPAPR